MTSKVFLTIYVALAGLLLGQQARAEFSAQDWVLLEIEVRQATVDGMASRLMLVQTGTDLATQAAQDDSVQALVALVFAEHGTDAVQHVRNGATHAQAIADFLSTHRDEGDLINALDTEFYQLIDALQAAQGTAE